MGANFLQLLILGLPLLIAWWRGRFSLQIEPPASEPLTGNFRPYQLLVGLLAFYLFLAWYITIIDVGWSEMVKAQGGG